MCINKEKLKKSFKTQYNLESCTISLKDDDYNTEEYYSWFNNKNNPGEIHLFPKEKIKLEKGIDSHTLTTINSCQPTFLGNHHWSIYLNEDKSLENNIVKGHAKWAVQNDLTTNRKFSIQLGQMTKNNRWYVSSIEWEDDINRPIGTLKYEKVAKFLAKDDALKILKKLFVGVLNSDDQS